MNDLWLSNFRSKLGLPSQVSTQSFGDMKQRFKNNNRFFIGVIIILTAVFIVGFAVSKIYLVPMWQASNKITAEEVIETEMTVEVEKNPEPDPLLALKEQIYKIESKASNMASKVDHIDSKINILNKRIVLVGSLLNNNTFVFANRKPRADLVFINRDWTIHHLPKHLTNAEELEKFVKTK